VAEKGGGYGGYVQWLLGCPLQKTSDKDFTMEGWKSADWGHGKATISKTRKSIILAKEEMAEGQTQV